MRHSDSKDETDFFVFFSGLQVRDLTTVEDSDYSLDTTMVTIPNGEMRAVTVSGIDDGSEEGIEIFEISIAPNAAYSIGTPSKVTVYIRDIDGSEPPGT